MSLTITADTQELSKVLGQILAFTNDLSPVMSALGMEFESLISGRFETEIDPLGEAWIPWKQSTVDNYPKGSNRRLLECFGDMLGSLNHTADQNSATVGFGDPKAAYHEWGRVGKSVAYHQEHWPIESRSCEPGRSGLAKTA